MDDLIARIRAAIAEDERLATAAILPASGATGNWAMTSANEIIEKRDGSPGSVVLQVWPIKGEHIIRHDPARVLRQVAARRKILLGVELWYDPHPGVPCTNIDEDGEKTFEPCELHVQTKGRISPDVLPLLAEEYGIQP